MTTPTPHGAMPELLPCPFCGGKAAVVPRAVNIALQKDPSDPKFGVSIICAQCSSETANMVDEAHAAAKWNRRASSPAIEPPKQQPDSVHLAGGECGGVQVPLTLVQISRALVAAGVPSDDICEHHLDVVRATEAAHGIGKAPRPDEATGQIKIRTYCEDCGKSVSDEPDGIHTCSPQYGKEASQINPAPTDQTGYHDPARIAAWNAANPDSAAGQGKGAGV